MRTRQQASCRRSDALAPDFQTPLDQIAETTAALQSASLLGESSAEREQAFAEAQSCRHLRAES